MISHHNLKVGNLILYVGKLSDYYNSIGEILSIDKMNDDDSYLLKVKKWNKEENEIRAYKNEIWPITLDINHLHIMGFKKDENKNIFKLSGITITRPIFFYNNLRKIVDKGFVVVISDIQLQPTEEEIDAATIPVTSFHSLQNYLAEKSGLQVDKTQFM